MTLPTTTPGAAAPLEADPVTALALRKIRAAFPDAVLAAEEGGRHPWIRVSPQRLKEVCLLLRDDPDTRLDCCHLVSGVDWPARKPGDVAEQEVVYHLVSYSKKSDPAYRKRAVKNDAFVALKVRVPRDDPKVPSVLDVWTGADWHERETWDLVGIQFTGRHELTRILLPEDWPGHPLRKDWEYPTDYHGIPIIPPEGR